MGKHLFTIFALIFWVAILCSLVNTCVYVTQDTHTVKVSATITDMVRYSGSYTTRSGVRFSSSYKVYVSYSYEGTSYNDVDLNEYYFTMSEGDKIDIYLDPDNPEDIRANGVYTVGIPIMASLFIAMSIIVFKTIKWKDKQGKDLPKK